MTIKQAYETLFIRIFEFGDWIGTAKLTQPKLGTPTSFVISIMETLLFTSIYGFKPHSSFGNFAYALPLLFIANLSFYSVKKTTRLISEYKEQSNVPNSRRSKQTALAIIALSIVWYFRFGGPAHVFYHIAKGFLPYL